MYGDAISLSKNFTIHDATSPRPAQAAVEAHDKLFFKNKVNPRPARFSASSPRRNTQLPIAETVERYFPHTPTSWTSPGFAAAYAEKKRAQNVCDYDDLLEHWSRC